MKNPEKIKVLLTSMNKANVEKWTQILNVCVPAKFKPWYTLNYHVCDMVTQMQSLKEFKSA